MYLWSVLISFIIISVSCNNKTEHTRPISGGIVEAVYASGIVKAKDQYQVYSTVNGLVQKILVTEGDSVKKGDAIMKIYSETTQLNTDNSKIVADYSSTQANHDKLIQLQLSIDQAKNKKENDQSLFERQQKLWTQEIGTKNELDQRELAYKNSAANYEAMLVQYNELKRQINFTSLQSQKNLQISNSIAKEYTVRSSINGKVYNLSREVGEMVTTQTPVAIIGAGSYYIELQIDEFDIAKINLGQQLIVRLDSYKGQVFDAVITKIDPIMNERTRTFAAEASFVNSPILLYPNLTLEANIIINTKNSTLLIPRIYLIEDSFVQLADKEKRKVKIGLKDYQQVEILSGITSEDIIIKPAK